MSFSIRNIREISNDPLTKFTNQLAKKLSKFLNEQQTDKLENKEDIFSDGQDIDVVLRFNNLNSTKRFDFNSQYFPPTEPDGNKLKLWIKGDNLGNRINDISELDNNGVLYGDPVLIDGTPFDYGIHSGGTKSIALKFNRPGHEDNEFVVVEHDADIRISSKTVGISYFMRVRIHSFSQSLGADRRLFEKKDDSAGTPTDGVVAKITSGGKIQFQVVKGGATTVKQADTTTLSTNVVYDIWFTYDIASPAIKIYINNVDQTLSTPSAITWADGSSDLGFRIMKRAPGSASGYLYGDLYDFMMFGEKIVSASEVGFHYTNKWTLANIPFGQVIVSNYWATYWLIGSGYTTTGYTTIGYDT